jgi:hypothetical protein
MPNVDDCVMRMWAADSLAELIGRIDLDRLPAQEGRALAECQERALDAWLAAYVDLRTAPANACAMLPASQRRRRTRLIAA